MNVPSGPVTVSRTVAVAAFEMVTDTPGSNPPPESTMVPEM